MKPYLDEIKERAKLKQVDLAYAFKRAYIPSSTFYRTINETTELRYDTAIKVIDAIDRIHEEQEKDR